MMDIQQLAELVKKMREAQVGYFRTRHKEILSKSKGLERRVDKAVGEITSAKIKIG